MKRFSIVDKGYDIEEVNKFIDIVINRLEKLNRENTSNIATIDILNKKIIEIENNNNTSKLEKAILAVQETSDRIKEVSREEARVIVDEAKNNANTIIHEALVKAEKLEYENSVLEKNIKVYKERIKSLLESQLKLIDDMDKLD